MYSKSFLFYETFPKKCSSVIFQQKSDVFANYDHKMPACVSIFLMKWEYFVSIGFFGQFYTNLRVKYYILPKKYHFRHTLVGIILT